jgi:2-oxoisovalerate dehydrogenase E2 component (dihydrolipoyl transacylase)
VSEVRDFLLPDLGEGLEDAEVVTWRVAVGEKVALNQVLVDVNTAKALVEIPSPWAGVVSRLHADEGAVVNVGAPLVSILVEVASGGPAGADAPPAASSRRAVLVGYGVEEDEAAFAAPADAAAGCTSPARTKPVAATPPVRRLAKELGVDLSTVTATGPDGRVTREDVVLASKGSQGPRAPGVEPASPVSEAEPPAPSAPGGSDEAERIPVRGTRRLIAEKMARSAREIPQVTTFLTVDCTQLMAFRDQLSAASGARLSPLPIVIAALVRTIEAHPKLNASFEAQGPSGGPEMVLHRARNVGIATDTPQGLLVPVVRDADRLGIAGLAMEIWRLAVAARAGRATPAEMTGSTITVSNVGTFGAEFGTPIINHPEGAILAVGLIEPRALVVDGRVEARSAMTLSLTFDHRLMDGAEAGTALRALANLIESPFELGSLPR